MYKRRGSSCSSPRLASTFFAFCPHVLKEPQYLVVVPFPVSRPSHRFSSSTKHRDPTYKYLPHRATCTLPLSSQQNTLLAALIAIVRSGARARDSCIFPTGVPWNLALPPLVTPGHPPTYPRSKDPTPSRSRRHYRRLACTATSFVSPEAWDLTQHSVCLWTPLRISPFYLSAPASLWGTVLGVALQTLGQY